MYQTDKQTSRRNFICVHASLTYEPWVRGEVSQWNGDLLANVLTDHLNVIFELSRDRHHWGPFGDSTWKQRNNCVTSRAQIIDTHGTCFWALTSVDWYSENGVTQAFFRGRQSGWYSGSLQKWTLHLLQLLLMEEYMFIGHSLHSKWRMHFILVVGEEYNENTITSQVSLCFSRILHSLSKNTR